MTKKTSKEAKRDIKAKENVESSFQFSPPNTIDYKLSNEHYVELGWTKKPCVNLARRITLHETNPSKPHLKWNKGFIEKFYHDKKNLFFTTEDSGSRVFYPNGKIAVKIEKPDNKNYDLYTLYTYTGRDVAMDHQKLRILATFDSLGNGLVLNENGKIRLSYNQIGGIYMDNPGALLPLVWTWSRYKNSAVMESVYTEATAARLLQILQETVKAPKGFPADKTIKSVQTDKKCSDEEKPKNINSKLIDSLTAVKIICLRLNEFMALRILDRKNIHLRFLHGSDTVRFELGFNIDFKKPITSYSKDISEDRNNHLKSRVHDQLESLQSSESLFEIIEDYKRIGKIGKFKRFINCNKKEKLS